MVFLPNKKTAEFFQRSWLGKQDLNPYQLIQSQPSYQFDYSPLMELLTGFEPVTYALRVRCSTS